MTRIQIGSSIIDSFKDIENISNSQVSKNFKQLKSLANTIEERQILIKRRNRGKLKSDYLTALIVVNMLIIALIYISKYIPNVVDISLLIMIAETKYEFRNRLVSRIVNNWEKID